MNIRKSVIVAGAVTAVGISSAVGIGIASAQTSSNSSGASGLIEKLATTFNLKKEDVQRVFDEDRAAQKAQRQSEMSSRLQSLVDDGKITADQKTLIENKQKEIQSTRETERKELETWANEKGIDLKYVMGRGMHGDGDRLQNAVDDKKITAEQKSVIEAKQKELETKRTNARDALKKWATDNSIDLGYLMDGAGHGRGQGGPGGMGMM